MERKRYFAEKTTIDDLLEDNTLYEKEMFKIALRKYIDDMDNESGLKSLVRSINLNLLFVGGLSFIILLLNYFLIGYIIG